MVNKNKIVKFCEDYLKVDDFKDYCHNGLQVEGKEDVAKIITGVSISEKLIETAIEKKADMIIVHHGLFTFGFSPVPRITGNLRKRLRLLLENDINFCGFHLPLDAHPEIGNNISLARLFNLTNIKPLMSRAYGSIGFIGDINVAINNSEFLQGVEKLLDTKTQAVMAHEGKVKRVGIVSGGAENDCWAAYEDGADTYICGSIAEHLVRSVEEEKKNFINAGHYNTEKLGVKNLGELIAKEFDVEVEFVDVPCDI
jgi:dinuclear metal center YbgI/SA1388 family protein